MANSTVFANDRQINLNDYPRDTRERYVASLALERNISYEEADRLEREESNLLLGRDEVLKYKTIDKRAGRIDDGNNYSQSVYIATEVRYVWNNANNRLVNIESAGSPYLYIPGASNLDITGGGMNIELYSKSARISQTCSFVYETSGGSITIGGDVISVTKNWNGFKITTRAKTFAINISESDLR